MNIAGKDSLAFHDRYTSPCFFCRLWRVFMEMQVHKLHLTLLVTVMVLAACGGGTEGDAIAEDSSSLVEQQTGNQLVYLETGDSSIPILVTVDDTEAPPESIAVLTAPDTALLTGAIWFGPNGEEVIMQVNDEGLPITISVGDIIIAFGNIREEEGLADAVITSPSQEITRVFDIEYDASSVRELSVSGSFRSIGYLHFQALVQTTAQVFAVGMCAAGSAAAVSGAPATIPFVSALAGACIGSISTAINSWRRNSLDPNDYRVVMAERWTGMTSFLSSAAGCVFSSGASVGSCIDAFLSAYTPYVEWIGRDERTQLIEQAANILKGEGGDLQISLVWDNEADLDLWVTEINSNEEKIWYRNPDSLSGGKLDVDERDGWGPENIRWKWGTAPTGSYKIEVNHYSGPTPANFVVRVLKRGKEIAVYRETINREEIVEVAYLVLSF